MDEVKLPILKNSFTINENTCDICGKSFKSRKSMLQHRRKIHKIGFNGSAKGDDDAFSVLSFDLEEQPIKQIEYKNNNTELMKRHEELRKELMNLILNNPNIDLQKNLNNENSLNLINKMTIEELEMRIFDAKKQLSSKIDFKISDGLLTLVNSIIGKMLNCVEELEEEVKNDKLLRECAKDTLSINLLNKIPPHIKLGGLYSIDVARAIAIKKTKMPQIVEEPTTTETTE